TITTPTEFAVYMNAITNVVLNPMPKPPSWEAHGSLRAGIACLSGLTHGLFSNDELDHLLSRKLRSALGRTQRKQCSLHSLVVCLTTSSPRCTEAHIF
ncbi:hypothetical protein CYMTET_3826, partial [Cymbomonas tetramitiformis]